MLLKLIWRSSCWYCGNNELNIAPGCLHHQDHEHSLRERAGSIFLAIKATPHIQCQHIVTVVSTHGVLTWPWLPSQSQTQMYTSELKSSWFVYQFLYHSIAVPRYLFVTLSLHLCMHSCLYLCLFIFLSELGTDLLRATTAFVMRNVPSVEHFRSSQCLWLDWMCQVGELTPNCGGIKDSPTHHWQLLSAQIPSTLACSCAIANHPSFVTSPRAVLELCANWSSARDDG